MAPISLLQAIRNAIEAERSAAAFYRSMVRRGSDADARSFIASVADQEIGHAELIEAFAEKIDRGELPEYSEGRVDLVETDFDWELIDELDLGAAITMALELEQKARGYYEALAEASSGELASFFRTLAKVEDKHHQGFLKLRTLL